MVVCTNKGAQSKIQIWVMIMHTAAKCEGQQCSVFRRHTCGRRRALNDARMWSAANGCHCHGLKQMFMYKQGRKVKFQIWSMIMHTAVICKEFIY
jgi:hypothetical protein